MAVQKATGNQCGATVFTNVCGTSACLCLVLERCQQTVGCSHMLGSAAAVPFCQVGQGSVVLILTGKLHMLSSPLIQHYLQHICPHLFHSFNRSFPCSVSHSSLRPITSSFMYKHAVTRRMNKFPTQDQVSARYVSAIISLQACLF